MKKILIVLSVVSVAIVSSCQKAPKNEVVSDVKEEPKIEFNTRTNNSTQLRTDLLKYSPEIQKVLFRTLNPFQKAIVWQNKLDQAISAREWSDYQVQLLNELKNNISENIYDNSPDAVAFRDQIQPEWFVRAKGQFEFDDLMKIVSILDNYNSPSTIVVASGSGGRPTKDCECSAKSDWCSTTLHQHCNISNQCNDSAHGCGTLWVYACRGVCSL